MPDLPGINYQLHPKRKKVGDTADQRIYSDVSKGRKRMDKAASDMKHVSPEYKKKYKKKSKEITKKHAAVASGAAKDRSKKGLMTAEEAVVRALMGGR